MAGALNVGAADSKASLEISPLPPSAPERTGRIPYPPGMQNKVGHVRVHQFTFDCAVDGLAADRCLVKYVRPLSEPSHRHVANRRVGNHSAGTFATARSSRSSRWRGCSAATCPETRASRRW